MEVQEQISAKKLQAKIGKTIEVIVDEVDEDIVVARSHADAPEIDGNVFIEGRADLSPGDLVEVTISRADDHDLWA